MDISKEKEIAQALADAWNLYLRAYPPPITGSDLDDRDDFRKCIHDAQRIVMAKIVINNLHL